MATIKEQFAWKGPTATLANSASDVFDVFTNGHPFVVIEITASSSGTLDVDGLFGAEAIRPLRYYFFNDTVETSQDPGDTCAVVAAQDLIIVPTLGAKAIRFTVAAGTLAFRHCACPSDAITPWLLMKTVDGITVTTTPPAILCYSFIPDATDELLISASARKLWGVDVFSIDATPVYVKLYDKATAASEADTPIHRTGVPANATSTLGAGNNKGPWPVYIPLTNGLSVRAVTGLADNSDAALTTAENYINVYWST